MAVHCSRRAFAVAAAFSAVTALSCTASGQAGAAVGLYVRGIPGNIGDLYSLAPGVMHGVEARLQANDPVRIGG